MAFNFVPRAMINQVFQWGTETLPGDGTGSAVNRLGTFNSQIAPVAAGAFGLFSPSGGKYVGEVVPTDIYAEGAFTDTVDFNTVPFIYAGNVGYDLGIGLGNAGDDGSFVYEFIPVAYGKMIVKSYVVQEGEAGAVYNYNNVIVPDMNMRFMRTGAAQLGGRVLGRKLPPGVAIVDATTRQGRAANGIKTGVWESDTWDELRSGSGSRLDPIAIDIAIRHNGVFAPWFGLDDSIDSFAGTLEQKVDAGFQITIVADVDEDLSDIRGRFRYASMEEGSPIDIQVISVGSLIGGATPYSHIVTMNGEISGPPRRSNVGPLRVWQWDVVFKPTLDDITGLYLPFHIEVVNTLDPSVFDVV